MMFHRITNVNVDAMIGDCSVCGPQIKVKKNGAEHYRCWLKYKVTQDYIERPYVFHKKDVCEECGFIPVDDCQLTVDHVDGNRYNNEISNLKTLCHNCHILKTVRNKDNTNRYSSPPQDAETSLS